MGYEDKIAARRSARLVGFLIDKVLLHGLVVAFGAIFALIGSPVFSFLYFASHDSALGRGRSLGRAAVGQRLMTSEGEPVSHLVAAGRNAVRWVLWATVLPLLIDLALVLFGDGRILADYVFDTRVFEDPLRVRQRLLASGRDEESLRRAADRAWEAELSDEDGIAARREVEHIGEAGGDEHDLEVFEDRLGAQNVPTDGDFFGELGEGELEAMRDGLLALQDEADVGPHEGIEAPPVDTAPVAAEVKAEEG